MITEQDKAFLRNAINLAQAAKSRGNLPIGAVITLNNEVVGKGQNSIWVPEYRPNRHAEIEAIESIKNAALWSKSKDMTLYTTLEPCLMCLGTILVHRIGRIIYGSRDPHGGAECVFGHMPYAFEKLLKSTNWEGPALAEECDELSHLVVDMAQSHIQKRWSEPTIWDFVISSNTDPEKLQQFKKSLTNKKSVE